MTQEQKKFIERVGALAAADMQKSGVLASLTIAQAILESGWGKSGLTVKGNALFGIKAGTSWTGAVYSGKTQECYDGVTFTTVTGLFRAYGSWAESVADHSDLLSCKPSRLAAADSDFISCSGSSTSDLLSCRPRRLAAANSDFVSCTASPTSDSVSCRFDPRPDTSPVFPDSSKGAENRSFSSDNARFCGTKSETPPKIGAVRSEPSPLKNSCETCPSSAVPSGFRTSPSRISAF